MKGKHCRLYDEQLVKNIMISTGLSIFDYVREKKAIDEEDICEFLDVNADSIIEDTLEDLNDSDAPSFDDDAPGEGPPQPWDEP